jgi:hypothetical protein
MRGLIQTVYQTDLRLRMTTDMKAFVNKLGGVFSGYGAMAAEGIEQRAWGWEDPLRRNK